MEQNDDDDDDKDNDKTNNKNIFRIFALRMIHNMENRRKKIVCCIYFMQL